MTKTSAFLSRTFSARRANLPRVTAIVIMLSIALGILFTDSEDEMLAYLLVTLACGVPAVMWLSAGATGIPVFPAVSIMFFLYYALPILRNTYLGSLEILTAATAVVLFLVAATLSWGLMVIGRDHSSRGDIQPLISSALLIRFMFIGLALGVFYYIAVFSELVNWLGSSFGLFRSAMLTTAMVACFMLGHIRAQGLLHGRNWAIAIGCLGTTVLLSWATLFLIGGVTFCLAALFGYVVTCKRVPWKFLAVAAFAIMILHAGKDEMRTKYLFYANENSDFSVLNVPGLMAEWVEAGFKAIFSDSSYNSALDRASLLRLLVQVQRLTPDYVPPLEGRSYAVLPQMLVPRFINEDKIASQAAMNMLNVHFGFQTIEGTKKTAIGWGLVAEAYANFGYIGVIGVGFILGLLCGLLERMSIGAPLVSLPSLVAVAGMMTLVNMEGDAAGIITALFQAIVAVTIVFWSLKIVSKQRKYRPRFAEIRG